MGMNALSISAIELVTTWDDSNTLSLKSRYLLHCNPNVMWKRPGIIDAFQTPLRLVVPHVAL
jgi:hypothetical protein